MLGMMIFNMTIKFMEEIIIIYIMSYNVCLLISWIIFGYKSIN